MRIEEKTDALYVKGVVIACGMKDLNGDTAPDKEGVKKIFTNYLTHETDVQHTFIKNFNVYNLENTILENPTTIAGQEVPEGSWIASLMVVNPEIQAMIREGKLNGFSLGAVTDNLLNENVDFLTKSEYTRYEDLEDSESINPLFISLVDKPANGYKWEVYDYDTFLLKAMEVDKMAEEKTIEKIEDIEVVADDKGFAQRIFDYFTKSEDTEKEEDDVVAKAEEVIEEEEVVEKAEENEITNEDILNAINNIPQAVITAIEEAVKNSKEEVETDDVIVKADEEDNSEKDEVIEKECNDDKITKSVSPKKGVIAKSTTSKIPDVKVEPVKTFLNSEERDRFGRNRKFL